MVVLSFFVFGNLHGFVAMSFSHFSLMLLVVMMMRLPGGIEESSVPLWQLLWSLALFLIVFVGIVALAARIYKVGVSGVWEEAPL